MEEKIIKLIEELEHDVKELGIQIEEKRGELFKLQLIKIELEKIINNKE